MLKYLKAAFLLQPHIPGIGPLPVNVVAVVCLVILGFGNPGFWLLGVALELVYLIALSTHARFQTLVDAPKRSTAPVEISTKRDALLDQLSTSDQRWLFAQEKKCRQIGDLHRQAGADDFLLSSDEEAMQQLLWSALKLLIARKNLLDAETTVTQSELEHEIAQLRQDLTRPGLTESLRESKTATLAIGERRLANIDRRATLLAEITSDLDRIDAQLDLALENAAMRERPLAVSTNIELASRLLDSGYYGASAAEIANLDATYGREIFNRTSGG